MKLKRIIAAAYTAFFIMTMPVSAKAAVTVGILKDNAPYSTVKKGRSSGLEPAVARRIFGKSVRFRAFDRRSELASALKSRRIQAAFGATDAMDVNQDVFDVSDPYLYEPNVLFRRHDGKRKSVTKLAGKPVGMLEGGNQTYLLKSISARIRRYRTPEALDRALAGGRICAAVMSDFEYTAYLKDHPEHVRAQDPQNEDQVADLFVKIGDPAVTSAQLAVVTYRNAGLLKKINSQIAGLHDSGALQDISLKYMGKDISLE